jgi:hypothetical protein
MFEIGRQTSHPLFYEWRGRSESQAKPIRSAPSGRIGDEGAHRGWQLAGDGTCATVTPSRITRSEARRAIQTSRNAEAEPT